MTFDLYDEMMTGLDEVEESHGQTGEALPKGRYPVSLENVVDKVKTPNEAVVVRMQLKVLEGSSKDINTFVSVYLSPSKINRDGTIREDDELKKIANSMKGKNKGFMKAVGVPFNNSPEGDDSLEKLFSYYNVDNWPGHEFMATLRVATSQAGNERNELVAFHSLTDSKYGLEQWRLKEGAAGKATAGGAQALDL